VSGEQSGIAGDAVKFGDVRGGIQRHADVAAVEGVNLMPVMVAVNAWMESWELGGGGVAVRTNETVALPPPPQFVQTLPIHYRKPERVR